MKEIRILVTGGGTGGHVSPALAVIQELRRGEAASGHKYVFRYVGSYNGVEKALVQAAGIEFVGVQTGKLRRAANPLRLLSRKNLADLFRIPVGIGQAFTEVRRFRPSVVLATGGYVSVPCVIAGGVLRRPVLIHEQTVQIGLANRIAARFATRIALSFEGSMRDLPSAVRAKAFVTGNPVREVIFGGDSASAVTRFGFVVDDNALPTVYVTGGAQGARVINKAIAEAIPDLLKRCRVVHQCGRQAEGTVQDFDTLTQLRAGLSEEFKRRYYISSYIGDEIGEVYALADIIVGRSGAGTIAEVSALGKPAVFVPLVPTGGDEQNRNAKRSADIGAAVIVPSADLTGARLQSELMRLFDDPARMKVMGQSALTLATPRAAQDLASTLLELADVR